MRHIIRKLSTVPLTLRPNTLKLKEKLGEAEFKERVEPNLKVLLETARLTSLMVDHIAKKSPPTIISKHEQNKISLEDALNLLEKRGLPKNHTKYLMLAVPHLLTFPEVFYEERDKFFESAFELSKDDIRDILNSCAVVYFRDRKELESLRKVFSYVFGSFDWQCVDIVRRHPYLLAADQFVLRSNLYFLLDYGFTDDLIQEVLRVYPHFVFKKVGNVKSIFRMLEILGFSKKEVVQMVLLNPYILSLDYPRMFPQKLKLLEKHGAHGENLRELIAKNPFVLTKSLESLKAKLDYLPKRHQVFLFMQNYFPKILTYNFKNFIKPRGDLMLEHGKGPELWERVLEMSDQEFCEELGIPLEELERRKGPRDREVDVPKFAVDKFFSRELRQRIYDQSYL